MDSLETTSTARRLGGALEPVIGSVYFAPEAHAAYHALGFSPSPNAGAGLEWPDGPAYATSRGSILGQVTPSVVASAFGVFKHDHIAGGVAEGWERTDAPTIFAARDQGALAQLERVLGADPPGRSRVEGLLARAADGLPLASRPLAAGLLDREPANHPLGAIFRWGDVLREFRGDAHNTVWTAAGFDGTEIGLLTELYWGLPARSYSRTRGWSEADFDSATASLEQRGLIRDDELTVDGRAEREAIEQRTDDLMAPVLGQLGDEADELIDLLAPWGRAIRDANGYPASGPHELAGRGAARGS